MKRKIFTALCGVVMIISSIAMLPICDGDATYICITVPLGLAMIFGQKYLDLE